MSDASHVFVFRYGKSALYALTHDRSGRILPSQMFPAGWQFEQSIALGCDKRSPKRELIKATLAAIEKHGFYLTHAAFGGGPLAQFYNDNATVYSGK